MKKEFNYKIEIPEWFNNLFELNAIKFQSFNFNPGGFISSLYTNFGRIDDLEFLFKSDKGEQRFLINMCFPYKDLDFIYRYKDDIFSILIDENKKIIFEKEFILSFEQYLKIQHFKRITLVDTYNYKLNKQKINLKINVDVGLLFELSDNMNIIVFPHDYSNLNFAIFEKSNLKFVINIMFRSFCENIVLNQVF